MTVITLIFLVIGTVISLFLGLFAASSLFESRPRALIFAVTALIIFVPVWFGGFFVLSPAAITLIILSAAIALFGILFFSPIGQSKSIEIGNITERVDERDIMFAREEYKSGTERYSAYYDKYPELKAIDDKIRDLPELLAPGSRYYDPVRSSFTDSIFNIIRGLTTKVDGEIASSPVEVEAETITRQIKQMIRHLGAAEVGVAHLDPMHVYSHVGRGPEKWGAPITNGHKYAVVFTLEMDYGHVEAAPGLPITEESAAQYLRGALISLTLARYIRDLGYPARAHISGSNYQIMLPPVAYDAGLGELGRHGYLISPRFGSRIRLGAVTTDLPLINDRPLSFGVQDFCRRCLRCAVNCPSASIPTGEKTDVRGAKKWLLNVESCLRYWRSIGTDCGLCMKVCPFSHPPTLVHNIIRAGIKNSSFARQISVWGEDILYGKKVKF